MNRGPRRPAGAAPLHIAEHAARENPMTDQPRSYPDHEMGHALRRRGREPSVSAGPPPSGAAAPLHLLYRGWRRGIDPGVEVLPCPNWACQRGMAIRAGASWRCSARSGRFAGMTALFLDLDLVVVDDLSPFSICRATTSSSATTTCSGPSRCAGSTPNATVSCIRWAFLGLSLCRGRAQLYPRCLSGRSGGGDRGI